MGQQDSAARRPGDHPQLILQYQAHAIARINSQVRIQVDGCWQISRKV
jgi:hypothetical protein